MKRFFTFFISSTVGLYLFLAFGSFLFEVKSPLNIFNWIQEVKLLFLMGLALITIYSFLNIEKTNGETSI